MGGPFALVVTLVLFPELIEEKAHSFCFVNSNQILCTEVKEVA